MPLWPLLLKTMWALHPLLHPNAVPFTSCLDEFFIFIMIFFFFRSCGDGIDDGTHWG